MAKQTDAELLELSKKKAPSAQCSYDSGIVGGHRWSFSGDVSISFDSHVRKSVPDYEVFQSVILQYSSFFISDNSRIYDVGCSTGTTMKLIADENKDLRLELIGIDCVEEMVSTSKERFDGDKRLKAFCGDAVTFDYLPMDLAVCCLSLQFINKQLRHDLVAKLYRNLRKGGAIIIFEKTLDEPSVLQSINSTLYNKFKVEQGLTAEQILRKANSLIGVLDPYTQNQNYAMLRESGFSQIGCIYKNLCFEGYLGIK